MDNYNPLYGDAKATARTGAGDRKLRLLEEARAQFNADSSVENQARLARACFDLGRYTEAEKLLAGLVESGSLDIHLLSDLAFVYKSMKDLEKAKLAFRKVIEANPRHALARSAENELWQLDPEYRPSWLRKAKQD